MNNEEIHLNHDIDIPRIFYKYLTWRKKFYLD